jgi:hypothetical protein
MSQVEVGGKKDAPYITDMIIPLIQKIEKTRDEHNKLRPGVVDLVLFDGASNAVKAGKILGTHFPHIKVVHGAEHVVALFLKDVYTNVSASMLLCCSLDVAISQSQLLSPLFAVQSVQNVIRIRKTVKEHIRFLPPSFPCNVLQVQQGTQSWYLC